MQKYVPSLIANAVWCCVILCTVLLSIMFVSLVVSLLFGYVCNITQYLCSYLLSFTSLCLGLFLSSFKWSIIPAWPSISKTSVTLMLISLMVSKIYAGSVSYPLMGLAISTHKENANCYREKKAILRLTNSIGNGSPANLQEHPLSLRTHHCSLLSIHSTCTMWYS